jgi:hypothetical protein
MYRKLRYLKNIYKEWALIFISFINQNNSINIAFVLWINCILQGEIKEKDFDIKKQTNGKSFNVVQKHYIVEVTNNFIEIHLFWAGKGTCCIPSQGSYGPSISALSISSYGTVTYATRSSTSSIIIL